MDVARTELALQELSGHLWRERQLLDRLEYKLVTEQLVLGSGQVRWLARASDEVAAVLDEIRATELARAAAFASLAHELGLSHLPRLRTLVTAVPEPWGDIFDAHRRALRSQSAEVGRLAERTREMLAVDRDTVAAAMEDLDRVDALDFGEEPAELALHLVAHQVSSRCAMTVAEDVLQPTLSEFLA